MLVLPRFGRLGASSRLRSYQFLPWYEEAGFACTVRPLIPDGLLQEKYSTGHYGVLRLAWAYCRRTLSILATPRSHLLWIEKELFPFVPAFVERLLLRGRRYVLDFDDAIFHNYDLHRAATVRCLLGSKIDRLMARSSCVIVGNSYLAGRARTAGAPRVVQIPTVIDLARYRTAQRQAADGSNGQVVVGWIGSPTSIQYLQLLAKPLAQLSKTLDLRLRVICSAGFTMPGVKTESIPWSEEGEVELLCGCDIGVMPLEDSAFERGKCGYKLIQYMACGLPVVASPVGVNVDIVRNDANGFLAQNEAEWLGALRTLIQSPAARTGMGTAGRQFVEQQYSVQAVAAGLVSLIDSAHRKHR